ncbi:MAG TPA: DUF4307 domain-containing protein [Jiangellales bacterium]|nr:DUF4307 domain-containing protein [Jiangellales bacterium]
MTAPVPARPTDRYGRPPSRGRRAGAVTGVVSGVVAVLLLVAVVGLFLVSPWSGGGPTAGMVGWGPTEDGRIDVVVDVRREPGQAAVCEVKAIDRRRAVVGTGTAEVPPGDDAQVRVTVTIPVEVEAIAAELGDCRTP